MEHKSNTAPLYEALLAYRDSGQRSFHVPGHKNGQVYRRLMEQVDQQLSDGGISDNHRNEGEVEAEVNRRWGRLVTDGKEYFRQDEEQGRVNEISGLTVHSGSGPDRSGADVVPVSAFLKMMRLDVTEIRAQTTYIIRKGLYWRRSGWRRIVLGQRRASSLSEAVRLVTCLCC